MHQKAVLLIVLSILGNVQRGDALIRVIDNAVRTAVRTVATGVRTAVTETVKGVTKGVDILTKGCCGLHPSYCENRKEFETRQNDIKTKSTQMDKDWAAVKTKMNEAKTVNEYNQEIYRQVRRVTLTSTLTVQTLDPKILEQMNNVTNELKKALIAKNNTVMNYGINEIGKELEVAEKETKTELLDATGIGGFSQAEGFIKMTADMFKLVKLDGVAKFLEGDVLGLLNKAKQEVSRLLGFGYLEKAAQKNEVLKVMFTALTFYNDYLNVFGNVFKVMELFGKFTAWITDLATCEKKKKEMEDALKDLRVQHGEINKAYATLATTKISVNQNWNLVFGEAKSDALLTNLIDVENIATHSSSLSAKMKLAATTIKNYRSNIAKSTPSGVISLQQNLIYAIGNISYNAECYQRKLATYQNVAGNCRLGKASMEELYEQALKSFRTNSDECKTESGLPYTTFSDVENYVKKKAEKGNYEFDCLLNSALKRSVVCKQLSVGYTLKQAVEKAGVNTTLGEIYQSSCPIAILSPKEENAVCELKSSKSFEEVKNMFFAVEELKLKRFYEKCS